MAEKLPWMKLVVDDWNDDLDDHPIEIDGAWWRICRRLWKSNTMGQETKTLRQWSNVFRESEDKTFEILEYIKEENIGDVTGLSRNSNARVTVVSRRLVKEEKERQLNAKRQQEYRDRKKEKEEITEALRPRNGGVGKCHTTEPYKEEPYTEEKEKHNSPNGSDDALKIYNHWNTKKNLIKHRSLTSTFQKHIKAKLTAYSVAELTESIDNYDSILGDPNYRLDYRWKIDEFMIRSSEKFMTENDPFTSYPKWNEGKKKGVSLDEQIDRIRERGLS